jgi:hypothetical protein
LQPIEEKIFKKAEKLMSKMDKEGVEREKEIADFYKWLDDFLANAYRKEFSINLLNKSRVSCE